ncbi:MAG: hypothetical protein F6K53_20080 [Moorea sp. SIO4A1]|uniref:hypothetical protein n=1 Tax=Moorena sp. SIO4A1 TaxID=2607835 RepID=UPI001417EB41|nr:hypothetical protein [Moorena sp. SIO4A1]NEO43301.1 hypothetical protein [Moorena sp. SIO4A3]NEQ59570.1 hypothetical protein [Moorena sp. SIO4A1]
MRKDATMVLGITIKIESGLTSATLTDPNSIKDIYVIGSGKYKAEHKNNTPILITNANDIEASTIDAITKETITGIFFVYPLARVSFVSAVKVGDYSTGIPELGQLYEDFEYSLDVLNEQKNLELGIFLFPQMARFKDYTPETGAESSAKAITNYRKRIITAADKLAKANSWLFFCNTTDKTTQQIKADGSISDEDKDSFTLQSIDKTIEEVNEYRDLSKYGHVSVFYGKTYVSELEGKPKGLSQSVPMAAIAAATVLKSSANEGVGQPPAGVAYPLPKEFEDKLEGKIVKETDYNLLKTNHVNFVTSIKNTGYCFWSSRTLARDPKFWFINTRMVVSLITENLRQVMTRFIAEPYDPRGQTSVAALAATTSILQNAYSSGLLSGNSIQEAYSVKINPNSKPYEIEIEVRIRPVYTVESITISVINELVIAA